MGDMGAQLPRDRGNGSQEAGENRENSSQETDKNNQQVHRLYRKELVEGKIEKSSTKLETG